MKKRFKATVSVKETGWTGYTNAQRASFVKWELSRMIQAIDDGIVDLVPVRDKNGNTIKVKVEG